MNLIGFGRIPGLFALLGLAVILCLAAQAASPGEAAQPGNAPRPNIIFILADDLGYGDLGSYGQKKIKTPHLDQLAAEGMRFTQFYAGSTVCAPSRCALMTGLHTGHCLVRGNAKVPLGPEDLTVAEILHEAGYRTGLLGKWGLGNEDTTGMPHKQGFDEVMAYLDQTHAHDYYTDHLWRYDDRTGYNDHVVFLENQEGFKRLYVHDLFTKAALNFVRLNRPDPFTGNKPFFLYLAYTIPHANNEEGRRSGNGMEVPDDAPYSAEPWPQVEKNKAAMITRMDRDIGLLLEKLKSLNLDENTIIFFSSDNGPHKEGGVDPQFFQSSGPLRGIKRDLYEGGIRVPLIVRWPAKIKPAQTSDLTAAFWDFLPTAAELANANSPTNIDGISFLPTLLGQTQTNRHETLYWEFHEGGFKQAARMGHWKAVRTGYAAALELYDLSKDIGEKTNVARENPKVVSMFEDYFKTARTDSERWPVQKQPSKAAGKKEST